MGSGKTTLGKAVARQLGGGFIDGDDHSEPDTPWYCSILRTSRSIVREGFAHLAAHDCIVIAYPLGCTNWIYFRRKFADAGIVPIFVTLRASYQSITAPSRGRDFDADEHARIKTMIAEGYDARTFSDLIIDTDRADFDTTARQLHQSLQGYMANIANK